MSEQKCDGYLAVYNNKRCGEVRVTTQVDSASVTVSSLASFYDQCRGVGISDDNITIIPSMEDAQIVITKKTATYQGKADFRTLVSRLIKRAGIMEKPMICNMVVPCTAIT